MLAAERDVSSMSAPFTTSSSLTCSPFSMVTPSSMLTTRTFFSPRKFRSSRVFAAISDVRIDGEVRVHEPHPVLEFLLDAIKKVLDVAAHSAETRELFRRGEVHPSQNYFPAILQ